MGLKTVAVIFGGQSSEHEVSCVSAANVIEQIDRNKYSVILIGITKEGRWLFTPSVEELKSGTWREGKISVILPADATQKCVLFFLEDGWKKEPVDVVFPVLHGRYGEDGTIQGLLELAQIPYVGCGVFASALSMDKFYTKLIVEKLGVRQAAYVLVLREELAQIGEVVGRVEEALPYPVFIKPCNAGSSVGVSKAGNRSQLEAGLYEAARHDRKILVEEAIIGREIECAVREDSSGRGVASGVGEILPAAEFYDYDAKYNNSESKTVTDPCLPQGAVEAVRRAAQEIFRAVGGRGLARVDFFVKADGTVIFNEINTMPGFTAISMYPMLWEARGVHKRDLVNGLLDCALKGV